MNSENLQAPFCALVTGGARRIGASIVRRLHQADLNVLIHCRQSRQEADALCHALNQIRPLSAKVLVCDFSQNDAAEQLMHQAGAWGDQIRVLVNNASCFERSDLSVVDFQKQMNDYRVNVLQPLALSIRLRTVLARHQGCIINITDLHAERPLKDYLGYCQTKAALFMQTKSLAREFAPDIRVNAVAPGAIAWPEGDNSLSQDVKSSILSKTPLKKHGSPEDIAAAVLFLVQHGFITGEVIHVDGGRIVL